MIEYQCTCGRARSSDESAISIDSACECGVVTRCVAAEALPKGSGAGDFDIALKVVIGPDSVGQLFVLGGVEAISLGKLPDNHITLAGGTQVSRKHAKLVRLDFGPSRWNLEDQQSRNGIYVNGAKTSEAELKAGDQFVVGDYKMLVVDVTPMPVAAPAPAVPSISPAEGITCPSCKKVYSKKAKICPACGLDLKTGRPLVISRDLDENAVHMRAEGWLRWISIILPIGILPIASEAFGTKKPTATWVVMGITCLISVWYFFACIIQPRPSADLLNLMHWVGKPPAKVAVAAPDIAPAPAPALNPDSTTPDAAPTETPPPPAVQAPPVTARHRTKPAVDETDDEPVDESESADETSGRTYEKELAANGEVGMRWWQFVTAVFLHGGLTHLAGNMLFLLVFGIRVNEAMGWWRFSIVYLLLGVIASAAHMLGSMNGPLTPSLGASGAIMGLAGVYFIFFPVQKVYCAAWIRLWGGLLTGFRRYFGLKIWKMRGFWLLLLWIVWSDVVPVVFHWEDGTAHWAHLGGFLGGLAVGALLLVARQANAHGSDLISLMLGHRARKLMGAETQAA